MLDPVRRPRRLRLVAAAALLGLVACTGGTDSSESATPSAPPSSAPSAADGADDGREEPQVAVDGSDGCGLAPDVDPVGEERPADVEATLRSGGVDRTYRLAVPTDYDPNVPVPLVLNLHGAGSNALQASFYGDVPRRATDRGMLVASPQADGPLWELTGSGADGDFLGALVDDLEARYCIDEDRIHLVGMSLGAWKSAITACTAEGRFASISLVTVEVFPGSCEPMPVIAFHGTADATVPYGEGADPGVEVTGPNAGLPGARVNIAAWAESGGCDPDPVVECIGDDVERWRYEGCEPGVGVELHTIEGGGHTWPGTDIVLGDPSLTTSTIDATELTLDWFEAHPRRP